MSSATDPATQALSPAQQQLHAFIETHPGLKTPALAMTYGLPEDVCATLCAGLEDAQWIKLDPAQGWQAAPNEEAAQGHDQGKALGDDRCRADADAWPASRFRQLIKKKEHFLSELFDLSPESIMIVDPGTARPLLFNRAAHERLGYSAEEFSQLRVPDFEASETEAQVRAHIEQIHRQGSDEFETYHRHRSGRLLDTQVYIRATVLNGREVYFSLFRDLTEQRALSKRLQLASRVGGIGIWEWDIPGSTLHWDRQMTRLSGLTPGSNARQLYRRWLRRVHQDDRADLAHQAARLFRREAVQIKTDVRFVHAGRLRWLRIVARTLFNNDGKPVKMIGVNWDVTESRLAQEQLADNEARFRGAFQLAPHGMALIDAQGRLLQVNQALCKIVGYRESELMTRDIQSLSHPGDLEKARMSLNLLDSRQANQMQIEKRYLHQSGRSIPVLVSATAVRDQHGATSFILLHILDLSERRANEAAMLHAKEVAEEANRAKSEFLANMSHEIRTPLNAIIGLTELTLGTPLAPRQRDHLEKAQQSSQALMSILNDILDYSKIEAGQLQLEATPFKMNDVTNQITALFQAAAERKGLELLYRVAPDVPNELVGDPLRFGQILNNLVGNAVKFTEQGHIEIAIERERQRPQQVDLRIRVTDTGIGMASDTIAQLFNAFTQADGSITRRYGGTGLGLTISQRLVLLMGGHIQAQSAPGEGTQIQFSLPFKIDDEHPRHTDSMLGDTLEALARKHVLVIEQRPQHHGVIRDLVQSRGILTEHATNCSQAAQIVKHHAKADQPIAVTFFDAKQYFACTQCEAAGRNCPVLGERMYRQGHPQAAAVLIASGPEYDRLQQVDVNLSAMRWLEKPVTAPALIDCLQAITDPQREPKHVPQQPVVTAGGSAVDASAKQDANLLHGCRVLVVEPNLNNQLVAEGLLRRLGVEPLIAKDGLEAVQLATTQPFAAVLMDLQMPQLDGLSATIAIRAQNARLPIIALTAAVRESDRQRCLAVGMNDHLAKPIDLVQLRDTLTRWIAPSQSDSRADSAHQADQRGSTGLDPTTLETLQRLLETNEYVPQEVLSALQLAPLEPKKQQVLEQLTQSIQHFDYTAARDALQQLAAVSAPADA